MMVERLSLPGGLKIYDDDGVEVVSRLSEVGETQINCPGQVFNYDDGGRMVHMTVRVAEVVLALAERQVVSDELTRVVHLMRDLEQEVIVKVDLEEELFQVIREDGEVQSSVIWEVFNLGAVGKQVLVSLDVDGGSIGELLFRVWVDAKMKKIIYLIKQDAGYVAVGQPLTVDLSLLEGNLEGELGLAKIKSFITGDPD